MKYSDKKKQDGMEMVGQDLTQPSCTKFIHLSGKQKGSRKSKKDANNVKAKKEVQNVKKEYYKNNSPSPDSSGKYVYGLCGQLYSKQGWLLKHLMAHHTSFGCQEYGLQFPGRNLPECLKSKYKAQIYECFECGRQFKWKDCLVRHIRNHSNQKNFKCHVCNNTFTQKGSLNRHILRHTGERKYKCNECGKDFARKGVLQHHVMIHTNERNFRCEDCGDEFYRKDVLNGHMKIHYEVKKFSCSECGKQFVHKSGLKSHIESRHPHTIDRSVWLKCDHCNKSYRESNKEHICVQGRLFHCKDCGKQYLSEGYFKRHLLRKHKF